MATAYSMDLRVRVLSDVDAGLATGRVAAKYGVSGTWIRTLKQRRRETGEIAPRVGGGRKPTIDRARLRALVATQPDATLAELRTRLGVACSLAAICKALKALGLTYKKRRSTPLSKTARTSPSNARRGGSASWGSTRTA